MATVALTRLLHQVGPLVSARDIRTAPPAPQPRRIAITRARLVDARAALSAITRVVAPDDDAAARRSSVVTALHGLESHLSAEVDALRRGDEAAAHKHEQRARAAMSTATTLIAEASAGPD